MNFVGQGSSRHAIAQFLEHHHRERNHQGLANTIPSPSSQGGQAKSFAKSASADCWACADRRNAARESRSSAGWQLRTRVSR
jgi:hypothetical protein